MTTLPTKEQQLQFGWNTLERVIIGVSWNLFEIMQSKNSSETYLYKERVVITQSINKVSSQFIVSINFDLLNGTYDNNGVFAVKAFQGDSFNTPLTIEMGGEDYVPVQPSLGNLESLFLWACLTLNRHDAISLDPDYPNNTLMVTVTLPLDYTSLIQTGNNSLLSSIRVNDDLPNYYQFEEPEP
jgi:hypothetical protein